MAEKMRYNKIIDLLEHGKPVFSTSTVPNGSLDDLTYIADADYVLSARRAIVGSAISSRMILITFGPRRDRHHRRRQGPGYWLAAASSARWRMPPLSWCG